ncbi:MAG: hypothetical protein ACRYG7_13030 [Janthinobacterium lividum]
MMPAAIQRPAARPWVPLAPTTEAAKRKAGRCVRHGCLAAAGTKKKYCPRHHHQALKDRDPISHIYSHRKQRAKARGHEWTLTLENFRQWCEWTGYHLRCGRTLHAASIDRKDPFEGYHVWNIASIPYGANSAKGRHGKGCWRLGPDGHYHFDPEEEVPF